MEVPLPLAASRRLISFLIFQISIYWRHCQLQSPKPCVVKPVRGFPPHGVGAVIEGQASIGMR